MWNLNNILNRRISRGKPPLSSDNSELLRGELLSIDLLKQLARELAGRRSVEDGRGPNLLLPRLAANEEILRAFNERTLQKEKARHITPAAEWLLDNIHLIEEQIRTARRHLPRGFNRQLPQLLDGPWTHFPRVYEIAIEFISHTDGRIDALHLNGFIAGYQEAVSLKLGELWAIPIMLRLGLIENLRRVAVLLTTARKDRDLAEDWADRILQVAETQPSQLIILVGEMAQSQPALSRAFVTEFLRRLQEKSLPVKLAVSWIEERLADDGVTVQQLVHSESQHQAETQVSVGNCIGSLRFLDTMDWREFVEEQSVVEQALRTDPAQVYSKMDFATRDLYRHTVELIARHSRKSEAAVAAAAIDLARQKAGQPDGRLAHVGFFLTGRGVKILERAVGMKIPFQSFLPRVGRRYPLALYIGGILVITLLTAISMLQWVDLPGMPIWLLAMLTSLIVLCSSQLAVSLVNWLSTIFVQPTCLPRLDFSKGVPIESATMVVVPSMLLGEPGIEHLLESLEVRYLANHDQNVYFALLTDFCDAPEEHQAGDGKLLDQAAKGVQALNQKYRSDRASIFFLFHRQRRWNERERIWMGYERKRGKLAELNHSLRGGNLDHFSKVVGDFTSLPRIKYVITLDTDTQLPRDAARQLAATMAHPLNRPVHDAKSGLVIEGYTILQPRVAISLHSAGRSWFARLFAGDPGIDPYTRMVSDVYQDAFQEGSFIGKGIYDVDAFERALGGKFPENRILSHDLLEGCYARSALVSDVQLFEEFPSNYDTDRRRRHRWIRGDWQIASWLLPHPPGPDAERSENPLTGLSRWKIFDNLRRSLVPCAMVALLTLAWIFFPQEAAVWSLFILLLLVFPSALAVLTDFWLKPQELPWSFHLSNIRHTILRQGAQACVTVAFLAYDCVISLDAIIRTLGRLILIRRRLLEWQTAHDAERQHTGSWQIYFAAMWGAPLIAACIAGFLFFIGNPISWTIFGWLGSWLLSPAVAWWISLPLTKSPAKVLPDQVRQLHLLARKTWNYFETLVTAETNWLPPDNFQEYPKPVVANRTSPTNLGLGLLASLSAYDFGYLSLPDLINRLTHTLETMKKVERYNGHFYNWYDTLNLKPLAPLYVSTVDNGNLAGQLLILHSGLLELTGQNWDAARILSGFRDTLYVLKEKSPNSEIRKGVAAIQTILTRPQTSPAEVVQLIDRLVDSAAKLASPGHPSNIEFENWRQIFEQGCRAQREEILFRFPWVELLGRLNDYMPQSAAPEFHKLLDCINSPVSLRELAEGTGIQRAKLDEFLPAWHKSAPDTQLERLLTDFHALLDLGEQRALSTLTGLETLAQACEDMARMDFTILYDPKRELFSVGYNVTQHRLDSSWYDLLASEARLTSYVAIALDQVEQKHWFRLGRSLTAVGGKPTLISWNGSMFEYLMPMLVMPSYENTLLDQSCKIAVERQIDYGRQTRVPWGISESGYNLRDRDANYQYRAFGVPGLGFKRGLAQDIVIAPYATVMALMVAPEEAYKNLEILRRENAEGRFGLYEALDYTASRLPNGQSHAVVRSFMAHHQGMSLLSLAYLLLDRPMQRRFGANPFFKSAELLLHERVPKGTSMLYPHEIEADRERQAGTQTEMTLRVFTDPNTGPPEVQLLSNGRYHVMVTNSGGGYSRWNDLMLTRWREDATRDCWGTYFYLRDVESGAIWSPTCQPTTEAKQGHETIFSQARAEFRARVNEIGSHLEIAVSPENDVEVRRITFINYSDESRMIEVTSYAEIVLNAATAEIAHPAFSNLFVQTQIVAQQNAVLCSRRPRAPQEKFPWISHLLLVRGEEAGKASFETARDKFIGRCGSLTLPAALQTSAPLSNSQGSVLDPIAAIRRTVLIKSKESATVTLVSCLAPTREEILALVEKYQDQTIADRCFELAWTHGSMVLRHLNTTESEAQYYDRLAGAMLYNQPARRAHPSVLVRNQRGQRSLWSFGISGDLPIALVCITRADRLDLVRQLVQAHAYWRLKGLTADLVILNEDDSVYRQPLQDLILNLITANNSIQWLDKPGGIYLRRADQLSPEDRTLLESVARIVLYDNKGTLEEQFQSRTRVAPMPPILRVREKAANLKAAPTPPRDLLFFNGVGGFTRDGHEYVMTLNPGQTTPAPWINVLSNPNFGTMISESGGAYTWSENCHEFRLTPWNNDAVTDTGGEAFYLRDEKTGKVWSATPLPARGQSQYVIRHGFGYSIFECAEDGISSELCIYVAVHEPVKFALLKLRNDSEHRRRLSVTGYWEWVLGESRQRNAMHIATEIDQPTGALLVRNTFNTDFDKQVVFLTSSEPARSVTTARMEFFGRNGTPARPAALGRTRLSGKTGTGFDPCGAMQLPVELGPGQEREFSFVLGAGQNLEQARDLARRFQDLRACHDELEQVHGFWRYTLGAVEVETPEPSLNLLANGWLLYQLISCRLWARTGFYQSGGAFGFRDQLQDTMALVHSRRELFREQLLRAAAHQFREGDVQHWWHPPLGRGVRTHISDDCLWLPYATCRYVETVGDTGVLDSEIPFLEGRALRPEQESDYDLPRRSNDSGTLYEHCVRAIKCRLKFGEHGLPLMGCGDWNDGMNLVGEKGKGESGWLAFFLYDVLKQFSILAKQHGDAPFAQQCEEQAKTLAENIEKNAWDGQWYRRAYFDNGEPLGSTANAECQIDSLPQSWAVISGCANADRARSAMDAVAQRLVRREAGLIQLIDPPFDKSPQEPGYIKGYVPGIRENGGQYTHAAIWAIMAFVLMGETARAWELFKLINPIGHAGAPEEMERYKVEPYVMSADVYSLPPHSGRGGWTWYTGSAGWMYRLILESFLGLKIVVDELQFTPKIPQEWKSFKLNYRYRETVYHITCTNISGSWKVKPKIFVDGKEQPDDALKLADDRREHFVEVKFQW